MKENVNFHSLDEELFLTITFSEQLITVPKMGIRVQFKSNPDQN